ncbi:MAG: dTDP-4-dehydrorhamnose 3,5-epimerase [Hyphomonas sp.]|nr:dTDP-4-dehydrorhamnose 3,5-epimerase [Hyphomonas sp.]
MTEFVPQNGIGDVVLVKPRRFEDDRGYFTESYNQDLFGQNGIAAAFVQDNHSLSRPVGTVRGLHFQTDPFAQGKLVRCTRGKILDIAVDIRHGSPEYGQHVTAILSAENGNQLFIPVGFAHAFCTLEPNSEVQYKVTAPYVPKCDSGIAFDDPDLGIEYPFPLVDLVLSNKDRSLPRLKDLPTHFLYNT